MRILRKLPPAPEPTRGQRVDEVYGVVSKHLEVRRPKPPIVLKGRPKKIKPDPTKAREARTAKANIWKEEARRLYREGIPKKEIATILGMSVRSVQMATEGM